MQARKKYFGDVIADTPSEEADYNETEICEPEYFKDSLILIKDDYSNELYETNESFYELATTCPLIKDVIKYQEYENRSDDEFDFKEIIKELQDEFDNNIESNISEDEEYLDDTAAVFRNSSNSIEEFLHNCKFRCEYDSGYIMSTV